MRPHRCATPGEIFSHRRISLLEPVGNEFNETGVILRVEFYAPTKIERHLGWQSHQRSCNSRTDQRLIAQSLSSKAR
jgi:hypothetical protein